MRIGILTHHYVKNYGAFLQMKGMYETLQRLYPEAEVRVINYVNQKHWRRNIIHILHFRPGVDTLSTYVEKIRQLRTFTKYERSIPRTRSVKTAKEIIDLKLDLIVLGSDEIWNLCGSGYHPLKFGTGLENQRTIAYAPSVGAVTEETAVPEDVFSGLKHLDRISGRDVESLKFVERACGRKAEKMLDPTFLYNFDMDIERENIKPKPYRYILIYDCKLTEPMAKQLQEYAKKNDLKIIGAGDYKTFYDEGFIDLTPYEWVDLFRNAEKVITGTFHGTVFSIRIITTIVGGGNYARVLHGMTNAFELKKLYETGNEHYWYYNFIIAKNEALVEKIMEHMGKTKVRKLFADHSIQTAVCYLNEDQNINIAKANFDI